MSAMEKFTAAPWVMGTAEDTEKKNTKGNSYAAIAVQCQQRCQVECCLFPVNLASGDAQLITRRRD